VQEKKVGGGGVFDCFQLKNHVDQSLSEDSE
jgi:hypothetical protein